MFYNLFAMDEPLEKLRFLSQAADWDVGEEGPCPRQGPFFHPAGQIYPAWAQGKRVALFKALLTSACERDCAYCPFRAGRSVPRMTFQPDDFAALFIRLYRRGEVQGLFLSSGIVGGGQRTQDRLLATAEILRRREGYRGYLHLKIMPGADRDQVLRAMQLADRISINLEAPGARYLQRLAPRKRFWGELVQVLHWVAELRREDPAAYGLSRWPSVTTQFVVGVAGESDRALLTVAAEWLAQVDLQRVYFSPFRPVPDTPLEGAPPEDPLRARRLDQAFFLLRDYGFRLEELPLDADGNLPRNLDPKQVWANHHLLPDPLEINTAPREQLLRIPGMGPRRVERLLQARREATLRSLDQLKALGLPVRRMAPYILLDGRRPAVQLPLWNDLPPRLR